MKLTLVRRNDTDQSTKLSQTSYDYDEISIVHFALASLLLLAWGAIRGIESKTLAAIDDKCQGYAAQPEMGTSRPDLEKGIRIFPCGTKSNPREWA